MRWVLWLAFVAFVVLSGCSGSPESSGDTTSESAGVPSSSTTQELTTTSAVTTTTTTAPTTTSAPESPTTTTEDALSISDVAGWVQDWLDASFNSEIDWMLVGASQIRCSDSGSVLPGDVFACTLVPQPVPGVALETAGVVVYVLDDSGRAVWHGGDVPDSTAELLAVYDSAPKGLKCRDLLSPGIYVPLFGTGLSAPADGYFWSLVYWSLEGQPDGMDADGNGIPCETIFDPAVVAAVLEGGAIGGHEPPPLGIALRPDGLGPVDFGTKAESAVESLVYFLGPADSDITSHRSEVGAPPGGACYGGYPCDEYVRVLSWDAVGLWVVIADLWPQPGGDLWLQPGGDWPPPVVPLTFVSYI